MTSTIQTSKASSNNTIMNTPFLYINSQRNGVIEGLVCYPVFIKASGSEAQILPKSESIDTYIDKMEKNPKRKQLLMEARKKISLGRSGLARLRLEAGLSQHSLAAAIGNQQSNISRWENGFPNIEFETMLKISDALKCDIGLLATTLRMSSNGSKHEG